MNVEALGHWFKLANMVTLGAWLLLVLFPRHRVTRKLVRSGIFSAIVAVGYTMLLLMGEGFHFSDFSSLGAVHHLFENPIFLLAAWVHYLAFDILIGSWIVTDAEKNSIRHWYVIPSLFLTFLFGPAGYLSYLILRKFLCKSRVSFAN